MHSLVIPDAGLAIGTTLKSPSPPMELIGLTLSDGVIEEMIKCVQNGKPIQLSLGDSSSISYGAKTQHLGLADDPFTTDIFRTNSPTSVTMQSNIAIPHPMMCAFASEKLHSTLMATVGMKYVPTKTPPKAAAKAASSTGVKRSATAGADAALAALQTSLATESLKKAENTVKVIKDGSLSVPGRRGVAKPANKPKLLSQNRSMPSSPPSGAVSPSIPLSQQQAEHAKTARKPVIHLLAVEPLSETSLQQKVPGSTTLDLQQALKKVGDLNEASGKWELRKAFYKELDVWNFKYQQHDDRQRAIDNAVKIFDKMRLGVSEPQWEKLLIRSERGTGKCLSKLQARIAEGPVAKAPKIESSIETPNMKEDEKTAPKSKGEVTKRSASQGGAAATKTKKVSEKEAQAKRLLGKKPPAAAAAAAAAAAVTTKPVPTKTAPARKNQAPPKVSTKVLSSEFVQTSDDEDYPTAAKKTLPKQVKRHREPEEAELSDSSAPLAKKVKKENPAAYCTADASQISRTTTNPTISHCSTNSSKTNKSNSPQKSSPLASSPPTNASDFEESTGTRTPSSVSPPPHNSKVSRSQIHQRHHKSSSVSSSSSGSLRYLRPEVTELARKYKMYYPEYQKLHAELVGMGDRRDRVKESNLLEMHSRLEAMKKTILAGIVDSGESS